MLKFIRNVGCPLLVFMDFHGRLRIHKLTMERFRQRLLPLP